MYIDPTLRSNPFQTYRDPKTGRWITVLPAATAAPSQQGADSPRPALRPSPLTQQQGQTQQPSVRA